MRSRGSGTLRPDGRWHVVITLTSPSGAKIRKYCVGKTQREAQAKAMALRGANPQLEAGPNMTVSDLLDYCERGPWAGHSERTREQYAWARARIDATFGRTRIRDVGIPQVYSWVERLCMDPAISGRSVQVIRSVLRVALQQAVFRGWIPSNPAAGWRAPIKAKPAERPRLTPQDILRAIATEPDPRRRLFLATLWETGCRPSEATRLASHHLVRRDDVWWMQIPGTKTAKAPRVVPITAGLAQELLDLPEPWFNITRRAWTELWHRAQVRLGWREKRGSDGSRTRPDRPLATIYAIRKARITEWREMGVTDEVWAALAGHEDPDLTRMVYDRPTLDRIARQLQVGMTGSMTTERSNHPDSGQY